MRKSFYLFLVIILSINAYTQEVRIHSHNDYQRLKPVEEAVRCGAYSIEVDVMFRFGELYVTHSEREIDRKKTLLFMYILPLTAYFDEKREEFEAINKPGITLFIDIKDKGAAALQELIKELTLYHDYFDRSVNPLAMQIIISGNRGLASKWATYPEFINFDGRLSEVYDSEQLARVAMISESYSKYKDPTSNYQKAREAVVRAHNLRKPFRFWDNPDNPEFWKLMQSWGVDLINTDKVDECVKYFKKLNRN